MERTISYGSSNLISFTCAGEITSRLSKDTDLMAKTVCLNVNVMLRTLIKTLGVIYFMLHLSWELTFLVLMEVPITGLVQKIYDKHYQVTSDDDDEDDFYKLLHTWRYQHRLTHLS